MRLDFSNSVQGLTFLYSVFLGVVYCLFYDVFKFLRIRKIHTRFGVFVSDILYFIVISIATFCFFLLYSKGTLRLYAYIGIALGFTLCRLSLSRMFLPLLVWIDGVISSAIGFALKPIVKVLAFLKKYICKSLKSFVNAVTKTAKKCHFPKLIKLRNLKRRKSFKKV